MNEKISATKTTPWYELNSPELGAPLSNFLEACNKDSVLDTKTKELLMVALASAFHCRHSTEEHIKAALQAGASKVEITEAILIAAAEGAGTQLTWAKDIFAEH